jgi:hypothetical protein
MLILMGGKERTEAQYRALLERAGLLISEIIPFSVDSNDNRRKGNWALLDCRAKQAVELSSTLASC